MTTHDLQVSEVWWTSGECVGHQVTGSPGDVAVSPKVGWPGLAGHTDLPGAVWIISGLTSKMDKRIKFVTLS